MNIRKMIMTWLLDDVEARRMLLNTLSTRESGGNMQLITSAAQIKALRDA
ncbi:MAG: hypothetical protein Q9M19_01250 [Mariprofundaceae bacterium]|nr:hypothetical protein [Mariprofundaceae bacterium]